MLKLLLDIISRLSNNHNRKNNLIKKILKPESVNHEANTVETKSKS